MSINSSSSNDSVLHSELSPSSQHFLHLECIFHKPTSTIFTTFIIANILLFSPLCIYVLYHGFQQWWQKRSTSSAATVAHSDCLTYHVVAMDLIAIFGFVCSCFGIHKYQPNLISVGSILFSLTWQGETLLQLLLCVERYLAVIHPITYLSLKTERGIRMRNVSIGCVWLLCFAVIGLLFVSEQLFIFFEILLCCVALMFASFCSFSVLCVLIRPHPGDRGEGRERLDQSKLRALYIIVAIQWVLVLRFSWALVHIAVFLSNTNSACVVIVSGFWMYLPSTLILPLLFLHRSGKLLCFTGKQSSESKG